MLLVVAILILSVLLFGSSAVVGAIGAVLGSIALFIGLTTAIFLSQENLVGFALVLTGTAFSISGLLAFAYWSGRIGFGGQSKPARSWFAAPREDDKYAERRREFYRQLAEEEAESQFTPTANQKRGTTPPT